MTQRQKNLRHSMRGRGMVSPLRIKKKEMTISLHNFIKNEDGEFDEKGENGRTVRHAVPYLNFYRF